MTATVAATTTDDGVTTPDVPTGVDFVVVEYNSDGTVTIDAPAYEADIADSEFREAVDNATSVADLKAALLGESGKGRAASRPS